MNKKVLTIEEREKLNNTFLDLLRQIEEVNEQLQAISNIISFVEEIEIVDKGK